MVGVMTKTSTSSLAIGATDEAYKPVARGAAGIPLARGVSGEYIVFVKQLGLTSSNSGIYTL